MKLKIIIFVFVFSNYLVLNAETTSEFKELNTEKDNYGATFRTTCNGIEVWLTNTRLDGNKSSRKITIGVISGNGISQLNEASYPINQKTDRGSNVIYLDGSPSFNTCNPNYGVFVSNRPYKGLDYDNDIYEMTFMNNQWEINRIDEINSKYWDDSPSISVDGRFIYFASTRNLHGMRVSELFISQKTENNKWSEPEKLALNGYNFETPLAHTDGYLYYTVDLEGTGNKDIWRVKLNITTGKPIQGTDEPIPFEGVNKTNSNQADPAFSPSGSWFMFSSNEKNNQSHNLYFLPITTKNDLLLVNTHFRTRTFDSLSAEFVDNTLPYYEVIEVIDTKTNQKFRANTDSSGKVEISIPHNRGITPLDDYKIRELVIKSEVNSIKHISAVDTLIYEVGSNCKLEHNLTIWDVNVLEDPECKQNFPITKVEFFLTSYWCPTTKKYASFTPCYSFLSNENCLDIIQPELPCEENDIYRYSLLPAKLERKTQPGNCIPQSEMGARAEEWSKNVDIAIDGFINKMNTALQYPCVVRSIKRNKHVRIEIIGWTDPRAIDNSCLYTGKDIDFNSCNIILEGLETKSKYIPNGILRNGTPFVLSPNNGNQLLSDLRAYYTAELLLKLWIESIPKFKELWDSKLINIVAVGKSVNPEQIELAKQRSVSVVVYGDQESGKINPRNAPELGRLVALCINPCLETLTCRELEQNITDNFDLTNSQNEHKEENIISSEFINSSTINANMNLEKNANYTIQMISYPEESKTYNVLKLLVSNDIKDIYTQSYQSKNGIVYYRIRVGSYLSIDEAKKDLVHLKKIATENGIDKTPVIVQIKK